MNNFEQTQQSKARGGYAKEGKWDDVIAGSKEIKLLAEL